MQINKHGSFYIRNGWPTKILDIMDPVTHSSYLFSPNNELEAVDSIGVGRVMVKSMRYWSAVMGLTNETKTQQGVLHTLTPLGRIIQDYDPYFQSKGTLWLLHRNLSRNLDEATAWAWAFNFFANKTFTKDEFVTAFYSYVQTHGGKYAKNAIEKEFDCFKNTYVSEKAFDINKIIEENTIPFFAPIKLIEYTGNGRFEKRRINVHDVPLSIFYYCILSDNISYLESSTQIELDRLLDEPYQVGRYMNLGYTSLLELLQQLENSKKLTLVNNFGNRYIQVSDMNLDNCIEEYFRETED